MKKIIIKEIDKLVSAKYPSKNVSEYLIYLVLKDGSNVVNLKCYPEIGEANKKIRVNELLVEHFINEQTLETFHPEDVIEEINQ